MKNYNDSNKNNDITLSLMKSARWPVYWDIAIVFVLKFEVCPEAALVGGDGERAASHAVNRMWCQRVAAKSPLFSLYAWLALASIG